jgi:hypothetical protein
MSSSFSPNPPEKFYLRQSVEAKDNENHLQIKIPNNWVNYTFWKAPKSSLINGKLLLC